jgi:hypothetical protein
MECLGRSLKDLIEIVSELESNGVGFISLQDNIDTTTASGKLIFHIFASLAEFEATHPLCGSLHQRFPGVTFELFNILNHHMPYFVMNNSNIRLFF